MSHLPSMPGHTDVMEIFALVPHIAKPVGEAAQYMMRDDAPFQPKERELIFAFGSGVNACHYCYNSHKAVAATYGVDPILLEDLLNDIDSAPCDEALKPIFRYVKKLTSTPSRIVKSDVDAILQAGWGEDAVVHAALICAFNNFMNRLVDGLGVNVEQEQFQHIGSMLNKAGYTLEGIDDLLQKGNTDGKN